MSIIKKILHTHCCLFGGVVFGILYLLIEAILHVTIYHGDGLLSGLLPLDDPHELWMRMVTFVLFVTFGIVIDVVLTRLRLANQERDRLVEQLAKRAHDLGERVKELSCLYGIDELAGKEEFTITDFIAGTVCLIPNSWQYPEITEGRIIYKGKTFETKHFKKTEWLQAADIVIGKETVGTIEVCYTKKMSERYEGPFLEEERNLINSIASRLSRIIRRKQVEDILQKDRWRLQSILNGTNVGTWEWNIESGETVFNERWAEIIGYSLEEISPVSIETWMEYANPVDLKDSNQLLERHFKGELEYYEVECRMKHKDGYWVWVFDRGKVFSWTDEGKPLMMFGTHQDISERKRTELALIRSEQKFQQLSKHDAMTGLLNRRGWNECIKDEEAWGRRYGYQSCVVIVDLDGLKKINDNHGHKAGDELIRSAAHCLRKTIRDVDKLARIGGDEFAILGVEYKGEDVDVLLKRIEIALSEKGVKASWGAAMSKTGSGIEDTIAEADQVMYKMKEGRRTTR